MPAKKKYHVAMEIYANDREGFVEVVWEGTAVDTENAMDKAEAWCFGAYGKRPNYTKAIEVTP